MPRALVLCEHPTLNGGERSLLSVMPRLIAAGWTFDVWCPPEGPLADRLRALNVGIVSSLVTNGPPTIIARRARLKSLLDSSQYDLVHANSLTMGRLSGPVVAAAGVPSLAHLRDIVGLNPPAIDDLNRHTRLLAVSEATRTYHVAQGLKADQTHVVYNGVDLQTFRPAVGREGEAPAEPPCATIGIIGQIILRKGQDVALAAAVDVMRSRDDVQIVIVGARHSEKPETRDYELRLHQLVAAAGMTARVQFLGTRDDMPIMLPQWTLLLHTPRQEPLGRVLLEAAACGVPIVATDVGGTQEIFPGGQSDGAVLVPVDDVTAAARACETILDSTELQRRLGIAGRRRMEAPFSVERAAEELLKHYNAVARL